MDRTGLIALLGCLMLTPAWGGDLYRWTDERGGTHYSDQPPPGDARKAQRLSGKGNVVEVEKESFDTKLARDRSPVVLYSGNCGAFCEQAQDHLRQRGIPYTLKDPSKEPEYGVELKKLVGALEVPVIVVGKSHQKGFDASSWDSILDAAGYPKAPLIPPKAPAATPPATSAPAPK